MPLAKIEIEQIEAHRWTAEIEAGGMPGNPNPFRRRSLSNREFSDLIAAVTAAYFDQVPGDKPAATVATAEFDAPMAVETPAPAPATAKATAPAKA